DGLRSPFPAPSDGPYMPGITSTSLQEIIEAAHANAFPGREAVERNEVLRALLQLIEPRRQPPRWPCRRWPSAMPIWEKVAAQSPIAHSHGTFGIRVHPRPHPALAGGRLCQSGPF